MNELIKTGYDMLYLSLCALNNVMPDKERVQNLNNDMLFELCQKHRYKQQIRMSLGNRGLLCVYGCSRIQALFYRWNRVKVSY